MKKIHLKKKSVWALLALSLIILLAMPALALEKEATALIPVTEVTVQDDGSFSFTIELSARSPYCGSDIGVRCDSGVTLERVTIDNRGASVSAPTPGQTEGRVGLIWFGFFVDGEITECTLTVSGKCDSEADRTITVEQIDVYSPDYKTVSVDCGTVVNLRKQAETTTAPVTTLSTTVTPTTAVPTTAVPVTAAPTTNVSATDAPTTDTAPLLASGVQSPTTAPAVSTAPTTDAIPDVPSTGDMNAPVLQFSFVLIAVIAASALIYITHKHKMQKGE